MILLLYFLSVPWIGIYAYTHHIKASTLYWYYTPWSFVHDHTPLHDLLGDYDQWCMVRSGVSNG
jgi:hypothetical protein